MASATFNIDLIQKKIKDEIGGKCRMHREIKCEYKILVGTFHEETSWNPSVDDNINTVLRRVSMKVVKYVGPA
jgi:hypothetical protein